MKGLHKVKTVRMYVLKAFASTRFNPKQHEASNLSQNALLSTGGGRGRLEFYTGRERCLGQPHRHSLLARVYGMAMGGANYRTTKKCPDHDAC